MLWFQYIYWHTRPLPGVFERFSLSCGGTRCVSNDTPSNSKSSQDYFYETNCATGKRTVVIRVQVSAVEQSQLLHRCSWMYDGWHDGFSVQGWSSASSSMGKSNLRKFSIPNCRLVLYSVLIISRLRWGGEKTECQLFIFLIIHMFMINEGRVVDLKAV